MGLRGGRIIRNPEGPERRRGTGGAPDAYPHSAQNPIQSHFRRTGLLFVSVARRGPIRPDHRSQRISIAEKDGDYDRRRRRGPGGRRPAAGPAIAGDDGQRSRSFAQHSGGDNSHSPGRSRGQRSDRGDSTQRPLLHGSARYSAGSDAGDDADADIRDYGGRYGNDQSLGRCRIPGMSRSTASANPPMDLWSTASTFRNT